VTVSIDVALGDHALLGAALGPTETWRTWLLTLKAAFGIDLTKQERRIFASIAGSREPPHRRVQELWTVAGRGSGKSRVAAAVAVYVSAFCKHDLDPGEVGFVLTLAASKDQAKRVFDYAYAFIRRSPILRPMITRTTSTEIYLNNKTVIACHANSFRSIRGKTLLAVIADEIAFWRSEESALPDVETYRAVKPSLVRCGGMLIAISSAYRRAGLLYSKYSEHYDTEDDDVLVVKGGTTQFNPTIDEAAIAKELAKDPEAARAEC
jgi:phage terminase large subunit-like protein